MSEVSTEWRVICADGTAHDARWQLRWQLRSQLQASSLATDCDNDEFIGALCGPHRVQSRTVTASEWVDADVNA